MLGLRRVLTPVHHAEVEGTVVLGPVLGGNAGVQDAGVDAPGHHVDRSADAAVEV
jgi:hypothetical protein